MCSGPATKTSSAPRLLTQWEMIFHVSSEIVSLGISPRMMTSNLRHSASFSGRRLAAAWPKGRLAEAAMSGCTCPST